MGGVYMYTSNKLNSSDIIPVALGNSLASSLVSESSLLGSSGENSISSDVSFLTALVSLKRIKIDTALFSNSLFNKLEDNSVKIEKVSPGRSNPFAPVGSSNISVVASTPKVVTDQPTQITDRTVVLNGTINASEATNAFFEYGTTDKLGTITGTVKQSLVGTFIKNVLGLTPKTNYFYKACAEINKVVLCGEVVSFTTN